jgi:hypothetical protein
MSGRSWLGLAASVLGIVVVVWWWRGSVAEVRNRVDPSSTSSAITPRILEVRQSLSKLTRQCYQQANAARPGIRGTLQMAVTMSHHEGSNLVAWYISPSLARALTQHSSPYNHPCHMAMIRSHPWERTLTILATASRTLRPTSTLPTTAC